MRLLAPALLLAAGLAHAQGEIVLDNGGSGFSTTGTWPTSTAVSGFFGTNYQTHEPNGAPPSAIVVDNGSAGFSATGTWPISTAVSGYVGSNYQVHAANGEPPAAIVADNASGSATGTWPVSTSVSGYYGTNYQVHTAGTGANVFTWTLSVPSSATYQVFVRWTQHPNRATNAKYTVNHAGGSQVVTVNMEQGGGQWSLLGSFSFNAGSATVSLSDDANDYVVADAVMLVPADAQPNTATWTLAVPAAGTYQVYARWTQHPNRATDAKYTVTHSTGTTQVTVNMEAGGGNWNLLGTFDFGAGSAAVSLTDQANGYVIADAVMLIPPGALGNTATWTPNVAQAGTYEVYARWTQHANRATNATYTVSHGGGTTAASVNQQQGGGAWNLLGTFSLSPGSTHKVTVSDQANGYVVADAIRLVPINLIVEKKLYFVHVDHLDTPREIYDASGQLRWRWEQIEPFGNAVTDENPSSLGAYEFNLRFPGQYFDRETNLAYNWHRDYDSLIARYVQSDPIGLEDGPNTYSYAASRTLTYTDRTGLSTLAMCANPANAAACAAAGIGAVGGGVSSFVVSLSEQLNQASCSAEIDWNQVALSTAIGAVTGAAIGAMSPALASGASNLVAQRAVSAARDQTAKQVALLLDYMMAGQWQQVAALMSAMSQSAAGRAQLQAINNLAARIAAYATTPEAQVALSKIARTAAWFAQKGG